MVGVDVDAYNRTGGGVGGAVGSGGGVSGAVGGGGGAGAGAGVGSGVGGSGAAGNGVGGAVGGAVVGSVSGCVGGLSGGVSGSSGNGDGGHIDRRGRAENGDSSGSGPSESNYRADVVQNDNKATTEKGVVARVCDQAYSGDDGGDRETLLDGRKRGGVNDAGMKEQMGVSYKKNPQAPPPGAHPLV